MRLLAFGEAALMDGFVLLGFETFPNAAPAEVEAMLCTLLQRKEKALVFLQQTLPPALGRCYAHARQRAGSLILIEIPSLATPQDYHPPVEALVRKVLGPSALEAQE